MKIHHSWALAIALAAPAFAPAAEPTTPPCASSSSNPDWLGLEISDLIERVSKRTGKQFILDPRVRANIPLVGLDVAKIDYARLLSILTVHQFAAYESDGVVKIVPDANARQLPIPVTTEVPPKALDDEYVTLLIEGKNMCMAQAVPVLRPLMPQAAHMASFVQSNTLVISDRAENARRIVALVERLDKAAPAGQKCAPETWPPAKSDGK